MSILEQWNSEKASDWTVTPSKVKLEPIGVAKKVEKKSEKSVLFIGLKIANAEPLAIEGGENYEDFHVTLAYGHFGQGGHDEDSVDAMVQGAIKDIRDLIPDKIHFDAIGRFGASESSDGKDVIYAQVAAGQLEKVHDSLLEALEKRGIKLEDTFPEYKPHMTLAYIDPDEEYDLHEIDARGDAVKFMIGHGRESTHENDYTIMKTDNDKRLVFGWASISFTADGEQLEDRQGDMIDPEDLEETVYDYVLNFRDIGEEHIPSMRKKGKLVESCVLTEEKQRAMGIPAGILPVGWWIGFKIEDDDAWERVKNGTYKMFSIEGRANREPIEKFNPYHDERGRFSTSDGYTSFTMRTKNPAHQKWADAAIAREKEKASANPTNDPDTIAGVKRGAPMTHEQADEGRANPEYFKRDAAQEKMSAANKRLTELIYKGGTDEEKAQARKELDKYCDEYNKASAETKQYRNNCQSCVVAYEARLRGYDVEAIGRSGKNKTQETLAEKAETAWRDPATGKAPTVLNNDPNIRTSKQAQKWLDQNVEEGGRYEFSHGWKGTNGYKGHIVTVSKDTSGSLRIFDPQNGKTYTGDQVTEYMGRVKSTYSTQQYDRSLRGGVKSVPHGRLGLLRVDNLQINAEVANVVLKGAE